MIPLIVPPLRGTSILVTRPARQAVSLVDHIQRLGGDALGFPALAIEPVPTATTQAYDLVVFVSVNAVEHGSHLIVRNTGMRIAAIGKATAAALSAMDIQVDITPDAEANSEALLAHPGIAAGPCARVLIVRGNGGRTLLQEAFTGLGAHVDVLEVYQRMLPVVDATTLSNLVARWEDGDIDIATITSVATLTNLLALLGDTAAQLLRATPLLVASMRIREAALALQFEGDIVVAGGADDDALVGALCYWRTRGRTRY
jgi:uroporphyrinogen-III synthase